MGDPFRVRIGVRSYELDVNGHVNHARYHQYGEVARSEHLRAAGCSLVALTEHGLGLVMLETRVRFRRELREGDQLDVDSRFVFGAGKTFGNAHTLRRVDGVLVAEIDCVLGVLDAGTRRLVPDPRARLAAVATDVDLLDRA